MAKELKSKQSPDVMAAKQSVEKAEANYRAMVFSGSAREHAAAKNALSASNQYMSDLLSSAQNPMTVEYVGGASRREYTQTFLSLKSDPNWSKQMQNLKNPGDVAIHVDTHENGSLSIQAAQLGQNGALSFYGDLTENMISGFDVSDTASVGGKDADKKLQFVRDTGIGEIGETYEGVNGNHTHVKFNMDKLAEFDKSGVDQHKAVAHKREAKLRAYMDNMLSEPESAPPDMPSIPKRIPLYSGRKLPSMGEDLLEQEANQPHNGLSGDLGDE